MKKRAFLIVMSICVMAIACAFGLTACDFGNDDNPPHTHSYSTEWTHDETHHWHKCNGCDEISGKAEHAWDGGAVTTEPTCTTEGEKTYTCTVCAATKTEVIATTEHVFSDEWTHDETHHWHECNGCDEINGKAEHAWDGGVVTTAPTCTTEGEKTYTCTVCDATKTEVIATTEHVFSDEWTHDETYHWHECNGCDEISGKAEHAWNGGAVTKEPTCTTEGEKTYTCTVCAATKTEVITASGHAFSDEWTHDETHHWHECENCDEISGKAEHTWDNGVCTVCKKSNASIGLEYTLSSNKKYYYISGLGTCKDRDIVIPPKYNDLPVTSIGNYAFKNCSSLESIVIPDSVTSIGQYAFSYCSSLTSVTIGNGVTSIGDYAFSYCSSLENVYITDIAAWCNIDFKRNFSLSNASNPLSIGAKLYLNDELVTSLVIPEGITEIKEYAFYKYSPLTSITIPDSITSIGSYAFEGCNKLVEVYNKSNLTLTIGTNDNGYIAYYAKNIYTQEGQSWLTDTEDGYRFIYDGNQGYLLGYYGQKLDLSLPVSFKAYDGKEITEYEIYQSAFRSCSSLTSITIPDSVTSIGSSAFSYCSSLTSITIPDSVTSIGSSAFSYCSSLTSVTIGNSVTSIGSSAFSYCSSLTSVTIGNSVTSIGDHAFSNCSLLENVYITDIAAWCGIDFGSNPLFNGAKLYLNDELVTNLVIPDGITEIKDYAFSYCSSLTSVTIGNSVTSIGEYAFYNCSLLENVYITDIAAWCGIDFGSNHLSNGAKLYLNDELVTNLVIPDGITEIKDYAFSYCSSLTSIVIPDSVTSIGERAFYNCSSLTSIVIPDSVTSIGDRAFMYCSSLTSIVIPDSVTSIGSSAFRDCSSLMSVTIGNGVTSIGEFAFESCSGLTSITIGNSVTSIEYHAFSGCSSLASIVIPDSVTSIGSGAFYECGSLTSVTIGNGVTSIGYEAFENCSSLTDITFNGTKEQWHAIDKGSSWNYATGNYTVHCTDGDITKSAS